jgi:hypothetical protein
MKPFFKQVFYRLISLTGLSLFLLWSSVSMAQLRPFNVTYSSQWDVGIPLSGKAERSLIKNDDGSYRLTTKARAMFASITESSAFNLVDDQIQSHHYNYQRKVLNKGHSVDVAFDWPNKKAKNTTQGSSWSMDIVQNTLDKQSIQLRLQFDLAKAPFIIGDTYTYQVADGGHLKAYQFIVDGEDLIKTPIGDYTSVRIKRVRDESTGLDTSFWFAAELDYTIVRILHIEEDGKRYQLNLKQLTWING